MRNIWTDKTTLTISCARGVMPYLKDEVLSMGYKILGNTDTMLGVEANSPMRDIMRLNLNLRTAQRVLWPFFQSTRCRNIKDLYDLAYEAPWEDLLTVDHPFVVNNQTINNPTILDTRMPTLKIKDAIVDRLREKCGKRPNVASTILVKVQINNSIIFESYMPLRRVELALQEQIDTWERRNRVEGRVPVSIMVDGNPLMDGDVDTSKINSKTLVDRLQKRFGGRLTQSPDTAAIFLFWDGCHAKCYIDTSSVTLSRRGYRVHSWKAPMQEALAAACIMATGWDRKSPFVVPFCGSGTPAIEAALIARNVAPGIFRTHFGFMFLKGWSNIIPGERAGASVRRSFGVTPEQVWKHLCHEARERIIKNPAELPVIIASDIDLEAIDQALSNVVNSGVGDVVHFQNCDFADTKFPQGAETGIIFMNPPYGERLEDDEALMPVYTRLGQWLKTKSGWTAWLITSSKQLSLQTKLKSCDMKPFWNGPLECRLLGYELGSAMQPDEVEEPIEETEELVEEMPQEEEIVNEVPIVDEAPIVAEVPIVDEAPIVTEVPIVDEVSIVAEAQIVDEVSIVAEAQIVDEVSQDA